MAFRNSLLLIAFFLVATTSVANCQSLPGVPSIPGVSNFLPAVIVAPVTLTNVSTPGVGVRTPLAVVNVTLNCSGVPIPVPTVLSGNGVIVIIIPYPNATLINSSCILSVNVSIGGVTNTITTTLSSLTSLLSSVLTLLGNFFLGVLSAVVVNGTSIALTP